MSRYVVATCDGYRTAGGKASGPGRSYVVLDSLRCYSTIAEYRTEDFYKVRRAEQFTLARAAAESHAARLTR